MLKADLKKTCRPQERCCACLSDECHIKVMQIRSEFSLTVMNVEV